MSEQKVKVLYILGAGRSGSTLLSNILGQLESFQNVGELYYLWENGLLEGGICGCGDPVLKCSFWSEVLSQSLGSSIGQKSRQMQELGRQIARTRHIPLLAISSGRHRLLGETNEYVENLSKVYTVIQNLTGCKVIVVASKFPSYAQILQTINTIDLYILHLVRDSRAVAFSWQRKKIDPATKDTFGRMGQIKSSTIWLTWNLGGEFLGQRQKQGRYLRIRYEDFIKNSFQTTKQILNLVEEPVKELPFVDEQQVILTATHSIAGNPVRFKQGAITLKTDSEWAVNMKSSEKTLATLLTWPLLLKYQYPLKLPVSS